MAAHRSSLLLPRLALVEPPVPRNNEGDVEEVEGHHGHSFPQVKPPVDNEAHAEPCGNDEEAHVPDEAFPRYIEGAD